MQRPNTILVFGVLNIVFAVLGFCGTVGTLGLFLVKDDGTNPMVAALQTSGFYRGFILVSVPLGIAASGCLLAAGIALLNNRAWGRTLSNIHAGYVIVMAAVTIAVNVAVLLIPGVAAMDLSSGGELTSEQAAKLGGVVGGSCGPCFGLLYPICMLIFLNRAAVREWLASPGTETTGGPATPIIDPWDR